MAARSNEGRWRARQSEVRAARGGPRVVRQCFVGVLFVCVVGVLVVLIRLLYDVAHQPERGGVAPVEATAPSAAAAAGGGGALRGGGAAADGGASLPEPQIGELMRRIRVALAPFQQKYLRSIGEAASACDPRALSWPAAETAGFLSGCHQGCRHFASLGEARAACDASEGCGGVTRTAPGRFELRTAVSVGSSGSGEASWVRPSCDRRATALDVWEAFRGAVEAGLDDASLHLDTEYPTREDGTTYLSISSYRDRTCGDSVRNAFVNAAEPSKLFVGVVQQNCVARECWTGSGWGDTRRWVRQEGQDPDCAEAFCAEFPHWCPQVRILRLGEAESYGPFFGRFANSKLYRGENYFLQIDAHTYFRKDWDKWIVQQMLATPSYPFSVISNYPPGGNPRDRSVWPAPSDYEDGGPPSALCGCEFEDAGGHHHTVRLRETSRRFDAGVDFRKPHHSCFVAAGFMVAHGSLINNVPFDPFMPYLFMGEEIAMTIRFWTSGYDVYGPAIDVLKHEYVRKDGPKFWESVGMVFDNPGLHNELTDLIIPRVQRLVGWKDEPASSESVYARQERFHNGKVRTAQQFVQNMNIQIASLKQQAPQWCVKGLDQPLSTSKRQP
jgi:hypothetical protein